MIIKKLKRVVVSLVAMATIFAVNPVAAHAEWKQDSKGWWYANGDTWYTGWKQLDGKWYFFNKTGYMEHNCYVDNYYLNNDGYWDGSAQEFSVKYPTSWIKSTSTTGKTIYFLDNKGTSMNSETASIRGKSTQEFIQNSVTQIKNLGVDKVDVSQQVINSRTVDVFDYKINDSKTNLQLQMHQVVFYNNNQAYIFTLGGIGDISSANKDSFNEMLKTVTF
jgi:hypothetical protein